MLESGFPSKTFSGVRFALVGFNPVDGNTLRSKLLSSGGVDVGQYNQSCTHLIVDKIVYDDPICVAARSNGKIVVTGSWVDHSFDIGMVIDANSVLYRPLKDLNGIPGAKSLIVCLTGYQRQDREDIMTMVDLMGGQFSKPLVANRVTHLICYKFEGEKYELAKRMKRIKLVNHRWLEDCLKNWKLLPEASYEISGYELEMMEASARDSEDEAEDASTKRGKTSPLGLRVSAVETLKDIPVGSGTQEGSSSMGNKLKDNWLTPKKEKSLEATVSTDAVAPNYAPTIPLNKTPEQEMGRLETGYTTTSINRSIRRHSSLASYSRQPLERSPELNTTGKELSGFKASTAALKSGTTLFEDLDKIDDKLHGKEESLSMLLPQAKFTDGNVSNKDPVAEESRPVPSVNDQTESGEVGRKSPASGLTSKPLSSNVVPMEDAISAAQDEIPERSLTKPIVENNILLQEPRSGSPKQIVPNVNVHTEAANKLDLSDSAIRLLNPSVVPMEVDIRTPETVTLKVPSDVVAEGSVTEPLMSKSSAATGSGLNEMKEKLETELPKKKTVPRKTLGTRGRKKNPINQKGSIYLSEPTPKEITSPVLNTEAVPETTKHVDSETEALKGTDSADKEISSPVLNTEAEPDVVKQIDSETEDPKGIAAEDEKSHASEEKEQDKLLDKTSEEANAEVEITVPEPELNDVATKDPSNSAALRLEVDKNKRKRDEEATSLQSGKKGGSTKAKVGRFSVKKTIKSRKEDNTKANDIADENEHLAVDDKSEKVKTEREQSAIAEETLVREEAETEDPSDTAMMQPEVEKNKGKRTKKATELRSGKKGSVKKMKKSKTEDDAKANDDTTMKEIEKNVISDGAQSPVTRKPLTRKEAAAKDPSDDVAMQVEVDKNKRKRGKEGTVEKNSLQSRMKKASSSLRSKNESGVKKIETVTKDLEDNSEEEKVKENIVVENTSGKKKSLVSAKSSTKAADKESKKKQLGTNPVATTTTTKILQEQETPKCFIVSGPRAQRNEYQKILRRLKGKCCRDSHQWSYQATHFIAPEVKRTEKFFAATSSGSWILKTDYVADSKEAGKLLPEEPYEWHSTGLSSDGSISLESPRKWRLVKEKTGHGALYGLRIVIYGDCSIPSLDTLKRAVKAGDGTILATAPPYTRFLNQNTDFALISPGMPRVDIWVQEFIRHEIPCVLADYIVEYVCKPGYALDKHVLYNTNSFAERSFNKLQISVEEKLVTEEEEDTNDVACEVCGSKERGDVMLICGDEEGKKGCGIGRHIDCCDPPLTHVPDHDWFCSKCSNVKLSSNKKKKKGGKF